MSSPIREAEDLDPTLRYAPRWARDRASPRAEQPLASPAATPARKARLEFSGDRTMVELQRQSLLNPDVIPAPIDDDVRVLRPIALRLSAVIGLAALIAWGIVSLPGTKKTGEIMPPDVKMAAVAVNPAAAVNPGRLVQAQSTNAAPRVNEGFVALNNPTPAANPPIPAVESAPAAAPRQAKAVVTSHLNDEEIVTMVKRGKDFLVGGDIVSARLLLRRAADAGSAEAALALGATYDPLVIQRLGAIGLSPNVAQARQWYKQAADFGSTAAIGQLAKLEQTQ